MSARIESGVDRLPARVDVLVLGSGAAGLVAALRAADAGASVCIAEKASLLGGTTSVGGGVMWAPATSRARAGGFDDSAEQAVAYLTAASGHVMDDETIEWYVRTAAEAVDYLLTQTRVSLTALARPDYRGEWPGAAAGGRSLDNDPFDPADIPGLADALRPSSYFPLLTMAERDELNGGAPSAELLDERRRHGVRTMGGALVGSLAASALDRGIPIVTEARAGSLRRNGEEWDVGFDSVTVGAHSVVVATGGFEWNARLRDAFLAFPITPISAPSNEGDGLEMGLTAGASVADMTAIWGVPVLAPPTQPYDGKPSGRMGNVEMTLPGSIVVNAAGERFVNEALAYQDTTRMFGDTDPRTGRLRNVPAWLVFDQAFAQRYPIAGSGPGAAPDWARTADTVDELAAACGIDATGLRSTIERFNRDAATGQDPQFGRGESPEDRFLGDAGHTPNPCLAPLAAPPFSAVPLHPGVLGTSGGLRTNAEGQVLDWTAAPIPGLYAAGNVSASVFRNTYPGGGATIGSAITRIHGRRGGGSGRAARMTRIGLIGAGAIGHTHAHTVATTDGFELAGIADPTDAGAELAAQFGTTHHRDHRGLWDDIPPDAVIIATPNDLHVPIALELVAAAIPMLVEKPIATTAAKARTLVAAAERAGVPVLVGHHRRYHPVVRRAKEIIASGRLGRIVAVSATAFVSKPDEYFEVAWRRARGTGGPFLINLIHEVDLLRHLVGEITSVSALASSATRGLEVEDTGAVIFGFDTGAVASLAISDAVAGPWSWDLTAGDSPRFPTHPVESHRIGGESASLTLPTLELWEHDGPRSWTSPLHAVHDEAGPGDPYKAQLQHLGDVVAGRAVPLVSAHEGTRDLEVVEAVARSAATGQAVDV